MPSCQAISCTNTKGRCDKSFFEIPDPKKSAEKRKQCKLWIDHLRNDKLNMDTFQWSKSRVVCQDHFEQNCFDRNLMAESLRFKGTLKLKPGSVPTIVKPGPGVRHEKQDRHSTHQLLEKRKKAQLRDSIVAFISEKNDVGSKMSGVKRKSMVEHRHCAPKKDKPSTVEHQEQKQDFSSIDTIEVPSESIVCVPEILSCGHPCETCIRYKGNESFNMLTVKDHSYSKSKDNTLNASHEEDNSILQPHTTTFNFKSSTPTKQDFVEAYSKRDTCTADKNESVLDETFISLPHDDSNDKDYVIDSEESECDSVEQDLVILTPEQLHIKENKYLVFESAIDTLVNMMTCNLCGCPVDPNDTIKDLTGGTVLTLKVFCTSGHLITKWSSQPFVGKMPVGNLLVSAATLFSGQTFTHLSQFSEFLNMKFISHTTFNKIQREYLMPVVKHTWSLLQKAELDKIKQQGTSFRLAGDGRCDSPGFSAKYCTYSLLDIETQHIVMFVVVKVTETGSSSKMEVEGFRRCMTYLLDQGFTIEVLATDRNVQIRSIMKKEFSNVDHQFDVWHLCKSLKKKLTGKAKSKGCDDLNFWIKAICNHLWWCASNCEGDKVLLEESWLSICDHIVNTHTFEGKIFKQCAHTFIPTDVAAKKKWLVRESKAHKALKEVVLDKRLIKDICQLSEFCHTGNLEVYHSLMLKYCPKRQEFDYDQMVTRTTLAVIDHNLNQNRDHKINKNGEKAYKLVCPKATGQWVVKPVFKNKTYQWVYAMMENVLVQKDTLVLPVQKKSRMRATLHRDQLLKKQN